MIKDSSKENQYHDLPQNHPMRPFGTDRIHIRINSINSDPDSKYRASATLQIGEFSLSGFRIYKGSKGPFVSVPSRQISDSATGEVKYQDIFRPLTREAADTLNNLVLHAYDQALEESIRQTDNALSEQAEQAGHIVMQM